ncbi:unnamed protein product [Rotaria magnacalcarata]|uniref:Uncharacterized protein n=1 Tax=Rotaria magnacalcarata TaxID=392030 RepID=A0A816ZRM6_9BILA|nr:unnamed protein product [Rotaria magnacalcarata]CAF1455517.1 unnamed protein product [Rotaria magnacalcarata]CAF2130271.1 unnamed protein product [Rotaria magnacalcarata]CAF2144612.1 unnamed protein product [Rotaria magnacalcarata]CAF2228589.1 unnamed protein product [Rotaria magnacalcarata]
MAFKLAIIGSSTALISFATYKYMLKPSPSIYNEKPFFEEALTLTRGYKPIKDKLVEPIKPLKIDVSNEFNTLTLLGAQVQIPVRGAQRSGTVYCYATRESLDDEWHVDKLEFKPNSEPNRYLFYNRALRRVPTPTEQEYINYKKEVEEKKAKESTTPVSA